jgi:hypothetical protein
LGVLAGVEKLLRLVAKNVSEAVSLSWGSLCWFSDFLYTDLFGFITYFCDHRIDNNL